MSLFQGHVRLKLHFLVLSLCWSVVMLLAMGFDMYSTSRGLLDMIRLQAETAFEKDIIYRQWNAMHGGVYALVTEQTQPNPYLKTVDREIFTPSGRKLTLVNPAYMTRQVLELERQKNGIHGHITSLRPLRPENRPDSWEEAALHRFESGDDLVTEITDMGGREYYRYMRPLQTSRFCLRCHADDGYQEGSIRGGLSVSVPMERWNGLKRQHILHSFGIFGLFWISGLLGLWGGYRRLGREIDRVERLRSELEDFRSTLDEIQDCVFMFRPDSLRFLYFNQAVVEYSGFSREELSRMDPAVLFPEMGEESLEEIVDALVRGGRESFVMETVLQHRDGTRTPVELKFDYIVPRTTGDGRIVAVVRDVRQRRQEQLEKQQMELRLLQTQKLEAIGQLAAGIAHEINTPTQYVATNLDFLKESFQDLAVLIAVQEELLTAARNGTVRAELLRKVEETRESIDWEFLAEEIPQALDQSTDGVRRVTRIVRAMKEFSHPASRDKVPVDLNHLIETTLTVSKNEWKYVAQVQTGFEEELPPVPCYSDELGQVLLNLFINAAHAIETKQKQEQSDITGTLEVTTRRDRDHVEIRIRDTGTGIPSEILDKIFEPFFTTKDVGKGTGQGLAIARDIIVNKHAGQIQVESEPGVETVFVIRLPLDPE